jgi:hypothetical protein
MLSFMTELNPTPAAVQFDGYAFHIRANATFTTNGIQTTLDPGTAGSESWFSYPTGYSGIDVRFPDWLGSGQWMQIIFVLSTPGYTGPASAPTLQLMTVPSFGAFYPGLHTPGTFMNTSTYSAASQGQFSLQHYGNWCGGDWSGGFTGVEPPIDNMDSACQTHDRAYATADAHWGNEYANAPTTPKRVLACNSWRLSYVFANNTLARAAIGLPSKSALEQSIARGDTPDVWGFDPRVFGPHQRTVAQRDYYRYRVLIARATFVFKDPSC